jgi:hypothetical protein
MVAPVALLDGMLMMRTGSLSSGPSRDWWLRKLRLPG